MISVTALQHEIAIVAAMSVDALIPHAPVADRKLTHRVARIARTLPRYVPN